MLVALLWCMAALILVLWRGLSLAVNVGLIGAGLLIMSLLRLLRKALRLVWFHEGPLSTCLRRMESAADYESWHAAARELDYLDGAGQWRRTEGAEHDSALVRATTLRLRRARRAGDANSLMISLSACMDRGYAGINQPSLFSRSCIGWVRAGWVLLGEQLNAAEHRTSRRETQVPYSGVCSTHAASATNPLPPSPSTKADIEEYLVEVACCIDSVCESQLSQQEKLAFLGSCRIALGRSGLALSGGGALALAHAGVVRCLLLNGLLPRVVSAASGGALVAGMMALKTDAELLTGFLVPSAIDASIAFFDPLAQQLQSFLTTGRVMDNGRFLAALRATYGDATFASAYEKTRRSVSIVVSVSGAGGVPLRPLLLNHATAGAVLIYTAIGASCALPGLLLPVTLLASKGGGEPTPWLTASGGVYDGSLAADLGGSALRTLFGCSHLIISQVNPHVTPLLEAREHSHARLVADQRTPLGTLLRRAERALAGDLHRRTRYLAKARLIPRVFGGDFLSGLLSQRYSGEHGDVTIVPIGPALSVWSALQQPSSDDMRRLLDAGQRATWAHLAHIRASVAVEKALSSAVRALRLQSLARGEARRGSRGEPASCSSSPPSTPRPPLGLTPSHLRAGEEDGEDLDERDEGSALGTHLHYRGTAVASFATQLSPELAESDEEGEGLRLSEP